MYEKINSSVGINVLIVFYDDSDNSKVSIHSFPVCHLPLK